MPGPTSSSSGTVSNSRTLQTRRPRGRGRRAPQSDSFLDRKFSLRDAVKTSQTALQIGKQALALVNSEKKFLYAAQSDSPGLTPAITPISIMATGDTASTRDGLSVRFKGLDIRGEIGVNPSVTSFDYVRVIVVRQTISLGTTLSDFLLQNTTVSAYNYKRRKEYKVLWDETFALSPSNASYAYSAYIPLDNVSTWTDVGATIVDTDSGVYYMYTLGQDNTNKANINWSTQLYFYDN